MLCFIMFNVPALLWSYTSIHSLFFKLLKCGKENWLWHAFIYFVLCSPSSICLVALLLFLSLFYVFLCLFGVFFFPHVLFWYFVWFCDQQVTKWWKRWAGEGEEEINEMTTVICIWTRLVIHQKKKKLHPFLHLLHKVWVMVFFFIPISFGWTSSPVYWDKLFDLLETAKNRSCCNISCISICLNNKRAEK